MPGTREQYTDLDADGDQGDAQRQRPARASHDAHDGEDHAQEQGDPLDRGQPVLRRVGFPLAFDWNDARFAPLPQKVRVKLHHDPFDVLGCGLSALGRQRLFRIPFDPVRRRRLRPPPR